MKGTALSGAERTCQTHKTSKSGQECGMGINGNEGDNERRHDMWPVVSRQHSHNMERSQVGGGASQQPTAPVLYRQLKFSLSIQQKCGIENLEQFDDEIEWSLESSKHLDAKASILPLCQQNSKSCPPIKSTTEKDCPQEYMHARSFFKCTNE